MIGGILRKFWELARVPFDLTRFWPNQSLTNKASNKQKLQNILIICKNYLSELDNKLGENRNSAPGPYLFAHSYILDEL